MSHPTITIPLLQEQLTSVHPGGEATALLAAVNQNQVPNDASAESSLEQWDKPTINMWRVLATFFNFVVVGATDGAYSVLIHSFGQYYHADYLAVSFILLSPVLGYTIAAFANNTIHVRLSQRGIAVIGPGLHVVAFVSAAQHPPYPVLVLVCMIAGLGSGLVDAGWNAWISAMPNGSGIMGSLHSFYGVGAALAPVVATAIISKNGYHWYDFYYLMASAAFIEFCTSAAAFWSKTGHKYRAKLQRNSESDANTVRDNSETLPVGVQKNNPMVEALRNSSTWLISLFIFLYAGIEISLADWILTLLVDVREQSPFAGSMITFGYWGGLTLGRIVIGFLIPSFNTQKGVVTACLAMTIIMHLIFSLKTDIVTSAIAVPLLGFFLGPLFPEAVIMQTKLVPKSLHVAAIGFSCALGSAGGCVLPFLIGAIANTRGIWVLQPFVLAALFLCLGLWLTVPNRPAEVNEDQTALPSRSHFEDTM